jgi:membrane protein DedA with SNARE-associated domain/membrane-associated phospholipid phosphatase
MSYVSVIIAFITAHPGLAYAVVFALAFSESVPVLGAVIPGSVIIVGISALVPTGAVATVPMLIAAISGAIIGDSTSYWVGRKYHRQILNRWPVSQWTVAIEKSERFIEKHGGKSVFLARFTPARAFVPLITGVLQMPVRQFYRADIVSALVWAPVHVFPGVALGTSFALAGEQAGRLALLSVAVLILLWVTIWCVRLAIRFAVPLILRLQNRLWQWSKTREGAMARHLVRPLLDPQRSELRILVLWTALVLIATWAFFAILEDVLEGDPLVVLDAAFYHALQGFRSELGDSILIAITELGDPVVVTSIVFIILGWFLWKQQWRAACYWAAATGFASGLNTAVKLSVHRARPGDLLYSGASEFSFPSGHATVNAVMYGFLAFMIARQLRAVERVKVVALALSFVVLIAFSRLYLGAHWFSDVAASFAFATAWLTVVGVAYNQHARRLDVRQLAIVACLAMTIIGSLNIYWRHTIDTQRYASREGAVTSTN